MSQLYLHRLCALAVDCLEPSALRWRTLPEYGRSVPSELRTQRDLEAMEAMVRVAGPFAGAVIWVAAAALGSALLHEAALYTQAPALLATLHLALALALLVVLDRVAVFPLQLSRPTWQALYSSHPGALAQGLRVVLLARVLGRTSLATGVAATAVGRVAGPALAAAAVGAEAAPLATAAVAVASGGLLMSLLGSGAGLSVGTAVEAGLLVASTAAHTAWHKVRATQAARRGTGVRKWRG